MKSTGNFTGFARKNKDYTGLSFFHYFSSDEFAKEETVGVGRKVRVINTIVGCSINPTHIVSKYKILHDVGT